VRLQKRFIGLTRVEKMYQIPRWWPKWLAEMSLTQAEMLDEPRIADPRFIYGEVPIETDQLLSPPSEEHVVLGLFGSHGNLLEEKVVYIGKSKSKHLIFGTRSLFTVPILRDITSLGLYKV
jgi:hypothetical protein